METPSPQFISSYRQLPQALFQPFTLLPVAAPKMIIGNTALAEQMGLSPNWLLSEEALQSLAGNKPLANVSPIALAYAGHQFGHFMPSLGDGRAALIGEIELPGGSRRDIHLKGSGRTAFSRGGDGRATLGPMLREYIVSEAMAALGIPTTRSLAVVATGETVWREQPEQGAILTRVAKSHVRVGTFQYLAVRGDVEALRALVDFESARNFPGAPEGSERFIWFFTAVVARQANLIAQWMNVGFIHGVMNTDNMSVVGETIDYGPCAFMDGFDPQKTFSSIDEYGRYAWDKQPTIALWNLTRLAEALLPLFHTETETAIAMAEAELKKFMPAFELAFESGMAAKLGFAKPTESISTFITITLQNLANTQADFTLFFSTLTDVADGKEAQILMPFFQSQRACTEWLALWQSERDKYGTDLKSMRAANAVFIARNHRIEQAITAANAGDLQPLHTLLNVLTKPFEKQPENAQYTLPPLPTEIVHRTFCGT